MRLRYIPFFHVIWHLFVLAASVCHWFAILKNCEEAKIRWDMQQQEELMVGARGETRQFQMMYGSGGVLDDVGAWIGSLTGDHAIAAREFFAALDRAKGALIPMLVALINSSYTTGVEGWGWDAAGKEGNYSRGEGKANKGGGKGSEKHIEAPPPSKKEEQASR